jgi:hypothetical protein
MNSLFDQLLLASALMLIPLLLYLSRDKSSVKEKSAINTTSTPLKGFKIFPSKSQFESHPFLSRLFSGVILGLAVIAAFSAVGTFFFFFTDAPAISGLLIAPLAGLVGAPWSIMLYDHLSANTLLLGIAAGILINGFPIGFLWGLAAATVGKKT